MPDSSPAKSQSSADSSAENAENFGELLSQYEKTHSRSGEHGSKQLVGTVVSVSGDSVFLDIGYKSEGILPLADFTAAGTTVKAGDTLSVSVKGRDAEGYYQLTRGRVEQPADWSALEKAFTEKSTIVGTVTSLIKGGVTVDVGVRAFMPASRSGVREAADLEKMVGQEIFCRIIKLDVADEDVVVDRRAVAEEEQLSAKQRRFSEMKEGDVVSATVRNLTDYGAFVDLGGVDALLHVSDISWTRIGKSSDVLALGQPVEVKILKISQEAGKPRISVGIKQLQPHPWDSVAGKYTIGNRLRCTITRVTDFGAFAELEPGIEGLIHVSEMSWGRKLRSANTLVKPGDMVDAVILAVSIAEHRISLGLKQALGDPWADAPRRFPSGTVIEGPVVNIMKFGAFVQLEEGVEGMIHISDLSAEKRINHPQEMLKVGQIVKAQVLSIDTEKRQIRLGVKQLAPSGLDEYIAEHKPGDTVSGRLLEVANGKARVELGDGVIGTCRIANGSPAVTSTEKPISPAPSPNAKLDLSSLGAMLQSRWKSGPPPEETKSKPARAGEIRQFKITTLDPATKAIELEPA